MGDNLLRSNEAYTDFDVNAGFCYLVFVGFPYTCLAAPCMRCRMTTQEVFFDGNRLHFKYDCCLVKEDKLIPLDRIQDANIGTNCCARICGVSILNIQTANGSQVPEAVIFAPRDPVALRGMIMDRRDSVVHGLGGSSGGVDGIAPHKQSPLTSSVEVTQMRDSLSRIEMMMEKGLQKMDVQVTGSGRNK